MTISMYRDTASHYGLCEDDGRDYNAVNLDIPAKYLENYYNYKIKPFKLYGEIDYDEWIRNYYIFDDMERLLDFIQTQTGSLDCVEVIE